MRIAIIAILGSIIAIIAISNLVNTSIATSMHKKR
jgi:hypothetical protein